LADAAIASSEVNAGAADGACIGASVTVVDATGDGAAFAAAPGVEISVGSDDVRVVFEAAPGAGIAGGDDVVVGFVSDDAGDAIA
jgi:hypothetical protein